jgi:hypothetical protein
MTNNLYNLLLMTIVIPSFFALFNYKFLNNKILLIIIISNVGSLLMIYYIQSIGYDIWFNFYMLIITNNLILSYPRFILKYIPRNSQKYIRGFLKNYIKIVYIYPNLTLRKFTLIISKILNLLNNRVNNMLYEITMVEPLNLISKDKNGVNKYTLLTYENNELLDHKNVFIALFKGLMLEPEYQHIGKKILIVSLVKKDKTYFVHKNIIIDENTTVDTYIDKIKYNIQSFYESGYPISEFPILQIKLWDYTTNSSGKRLSTSNSIYQFGRGFHTSSVNSKIKYDNSIKPLPQPKILIRGEIATLDLETIEFNGNQLPISISFSYISDCEIITIFELIDYKLLLKSSDEAVKLLWLTFISKLNEMNFGKITIFTHNLGSFDGYFIFKGLLNLPDVDIDGVNSIIDNRNKFISIDFKWRNINLTFKDSMRIFPVSLNDLCEIFGVTGKLDKYNPLFNKISLFENDMLLNQFIEYSKRDSLCLLKALLEAQDIYIREHNIDLSSIWSSSTLAMKIFRQRFLKTVIPTLTNKLDKLIRLAYIGGSTDYYLKYGENLKHYDVNSLYPKAMCNPMPIKFLGAKQGVDCRLEDIFGFVEARITTPNNLEVPLLPFKLNNETIHPLGSWIGLYFSEELKEVVKHGYKVELIMVYEFSKENIFNDYIEYFYNIKKNSKGALRYIAKMLLNQLYGYFGRRKTLIETKNVYNKDLIQYYGKYTIFSEIQINDNITTVLMSSNLDYDLINEIQGETNLDFKNVIKSVKSHVGIAAAVTSYARIEMIKFKVALMKLDIKLFYTDTDSIFIDSELPIHLIGNDLGQMKDELDGGYIKKAYFLGIKKYGYIDNNNITHSVFSGVERNSLTFEEISKIGNGFTIVKQTPLRIYKNIHNLNLQIRDSLSTTIKFNPNKSLDCNRFLPIKINLEVLVKLDYYLRIIKNRILHIIKKNGIGRIQ